MCISFILVFSNTSNGLIIVYVCVCLILTYMLIHMQYIPCVFPFMLVFTADDSVNTTYIHFFKLIFRSGYERVQYVNNINTI